MKQMKQVILMAGLMTGLLGCGNGKNDQGTSGNKTDQNSTAKEKTRKATKLEHKPINPDTVALPLNNGQKWELDSATKLPMVRISQEIEKKGKGLQKMDEAAFKQLAAKLDPRIQKIADNHNLEGKGEKALATLLDYMRREADMMRQGDKKQAQVALLNLSELMGVYRDHFK